MATLQIEFNCLCLFARDEDANVVHVLMPSTAGHVHHANHREGGVHAHDEAGADQDAGSGGSGGAVDQHVVRLIYPIFPEPEQMRKPLEGWHLTVRHASGAADTTLGSFPDAEIVDITRLTQATGTSGGLRVDPALAVFDPSTGLHGKVVCLITLRGGHMITAESEMDWEFNGRPVKMAHQATWQIEDVQEALEWRSATNDPPPLPSLASLGAPTTLPNGQIGYRLSIYHTTSDALPPNHRGVRNPAEVARHFHAYYEMLGEPNPTEPQLPKGLLARTVNCGVAQALIK